MDKEAYENRKKELKETCEIDLEILEMEYKGKTKSTCFKNKKYFIRTIGFDSCNNLKFEYVKIEELDSVGELYININYYNSVKDFKENFDNDVSGGAPVKITKEEYIEKITEIVKNTFKEK